MPDLSDADVAAVAAALTGPQRQMPPMVSAIKVGGTRLHELARRGEEVERAARDIEVYAFGARLSAPDEVAFEVECSTGTYVRVARSTTWPSASAPSGT